MWSMCTTSSSSGWPSDAMGMDPSLTVGSTRAKLLSEWMSRLSFKPIYLQLSENTSNGRLWNVRCFNIRSPFSCGPALFLRLSFLVTLPEKRSLFSFAFGDSLCVVSGSPSPSLLRSGLIFCLPAELLLGASFCVRQFVWSCQVAAA